MTIGTPIAVKARVPIIFRDWSNLMPLYQKTPPNSEGISRIPVRTIRESDARGADESKRSTYVQIPAIELVRREFCATNPVGTLIDDLVRSIAARIGRSAGAITPALKRLQDDGWISYCSDAHGMLIEVLRSDLGTLPLDQASDRVDLPSAPPAMPESALGSDEPPAALDQVPDRDSTALGCDQAHDRSACMVHDDSKIQEEESARPPSFSFETDPLYQRLIANPRMNRTLARTIAQAPPGTVADFESDLRVAQTFARTPFWFTVDKWQEQQRVIAPEEPRDERPAARSASTGTRRRAAPNRSEQAADPATDAEYRAYLAECLAAPKATSADFPGLPVPGQRGAAYGN